MYGENLNTEIIELVKKVNILLETLKVTPGEGSEWVTKEVAMKMLNCSERTLQTLRDNRSPCLIRDQLKDQNSFIGKKI